MKALFAAAGISDEDTYLVDGSGLSRLTLVCPESSTKILLHLWNSPERDVWLRSLPIGAEDGTLENRFQGFAESRAREGEDGEFDARGSAVWVFGASKARDAGV